MKSLHHTHIWSLEGEHHVFTSHIVLKEVENFDQVLEVKNAKKECLEEYQFEHYTIETELDSETCKLR